MEQQDKLPQTYVQAAETIKNAILRGQYEALKGENRIQLAVYFGVGRYVSHNSRKGTWGTGALEAISGRLRKILPGLRGFSGNSLKNMRKFYEKWSMLDSAAREPVVARTGTGEDKTTIAIVDLAKAPSDIDIHHALSFGDAAFPVEDFLGTPFTHHLRIIESAGSMDERFYYIRRCAREHLSVEALRQLIKENAFGNRQAMANNFTATISTGKDARKAVMMFKDEYALDFINVEQIGERDAEDVDERLVEQQIVQNIKKFIMTFGHDFAFVGNQYRMEVYGVEHYPDLVFFNRELNALVIVELKIGEFKTSYLGQLMGYLTIADDHLRKPHENPAIGIVLRQQRQQELRPIHGQTVQQAHGSGHLQDRRGYAGEAAQSPARHRRAQAAALTQRDTVGDAPQKIPGRAAKTILPRRKKKGGTPHISLWRAARSVCGRSGALTLHTLCA